MSRAARYPTVSLKPRREAPLLAGHAWVFSGAIHQLARPAETGEIVDVRTAEGAFIGRGYYHPQMDIAVRLLTRDPEEAIDVAFLRRMIRQAARLREALNRDETNAFRLVNSEGDGLPGVVIDSYAGVLVAQISTAGIERLREPLVQALVEEVQPRGVLLRGDTSSRTREGLRREPPTVAAGEVPEQIEIREHGLRFQVDPWQGQKTGFFLDQRDKRLALQKYALGREGAELLQLYQRVWRLCRHDQPTNAGDERGYLRACAGGSARQLRAERSGPGAACLCGPRCL